jgi:hypothetical protein
VHRIQRRRAGSLGGAPASAGSLGGAPASAGSLGGAPASAGGRQRCLMRAHILSGGCGHLAQLVDALEASEVTVMSPAAVFQLVFGALVRLYRKSQRFAGVSPASPDPLTLELLKALQRCSGRRVPARGRRSPL